MLQARQTQFHFPSEIDKGLISSCWLGRSALPAIRLAQKLPLNRRATRWSHSAKTNRITPDFAGLLSLAYAVLGEKNSALKESERAIMLLPSAKDRMNGPTFEESLALIQTMFGENSRAISTLTRLLQTPYGSWLYGQRLLRRPF